MKLHPAEKIVLGVVWCIILYIAYCIGNGNADITSWSYYGRAWLGGFIAFSMVFIFIWIVSDIDN